MAGPSDEQIISGIVDALPMGVWVARAPGGELVYANARFAEILGLDARADVGVGEYAEPYAIHDRDGALYPEDRMPFVRALQARETVVVDDIVIHRTDGGRTHIRADARPIFDGEEISHVLVAFFDITREVEAETQLRRAQRMESIGNLAGGIAHDFNNLLAVVRTIVSTLLLGEKEPKRREALESIDAATESAVQLTRSLLGFSGRGKNLAAPVDIDALVSSLSEMLVRVLDRRITLRTELDARRSVQADASQLEQVVMNLVLNARDALDGCGVITVRTRSSGAHLVLEVDDSGPGVPRSIRGRIFEPYFTTKKGHARHSAGLGLATVYGIVEGHGGTVEVLDAVDGGARFQVCLPALGDAPAPSRPSERPQEIVKGEGLILLVDDDDAVRGSLASGLEAIGYTVARARDGEEAVECFRKEPGGFAGVLLDMSMPKLDGRGTYLALRELDPEVRVLLMTGYALNEEAQEILDLGVRGFLAKPFRLGDLSEALTQLLS